MARVRTTRSGTSFTSLPARSADSRVGVVLFTSLLALRAVALPTRIPITGGITNPHRITVDRKPVMEVTLVTGIRDAPPTHTAFMTDIAPRHYQPVLPLVLYRITAGIIPHRIIGGIITDIASPATGKKSLASARVTRFITVFIDRQLVGDCVYRRIGIH